LRPPRLGSRLAKSESAHLGRGEQLDELKYFALDLTDEARARVKIYVRHHARRPRSWSTRRCRAPSQPGETLDFVRTMRGGSAVCTRAPRSRAPRSSVISMIVLPPPRCMCRFAHMLGTTKRCDSEFEISDPAGGDPGLYDSILSAYANAISISGSACNLGPRCVAKTTRFG